MADIKNAPTWGMIGVFTIAFSLGLYFTFAAIQGDYGLLRRAEILAEAEKYQQELNALSAEVIMMKNLTLRLSDAYLDLELLDQQARDILGYVRVDEMIIQ